MESEVNYVSGYYQAPGLQQALFHEWKTVTEWIKGADRGVRDPVTNPHGRPPNL